MDGKVRHRPTTFMGVKDLTRLFSSPNCSNNEEVRICPAAQTLFSVQPISRVLEVQMISNSCHLIYVEYYNPVTFSIELIFSIVILDFLFCNCCCKYVKLATNLCISVTK
jgi:hypothetical protein